MGRCVGPVGCVALAVFGCGSGDGSRPAVYPVRGRVVFEGAPAAGAVVRFHPAGDAPALPLPPQARTGPDGSFAVTTFATADGAPAGEYRLSVLWADRPAEDQAGDGPSRLPGRYARPETSGLSARVAPDPRGTELAVLRLTR